MAKFIEQEASIYHYVLVYSAGSGVLYLFTALTEAPPEASSFQSWLFWLVAHILYGVIVGIMIKNWIYQPSHQKEYDK